MLIAGPESAEREQESLFRNDTRRRGQWSPVSPRETRGDKLPSETVTVKRENGKDFLTPTVIQSDLLVYTPFPSQLLHENNSPPEIFL